MLSTLVSCAMKQETLVFYTFIEKSTIRYNTIAHMNKLFIYTIFSNFSSLCIFKFDMSIF